MTNPRPPRRGVAACGISLLLAACTPPTDDDAVPELEDWSEDTDESSADEDSDSPMLDGNAAPSKIFEPSAARYPIRLHAIVLRNQNGDKSCPLTPADLTSAVHRTNQFFAPAGIELQFDETTDWQTMADDTLNLMDRGASSWPSYPNTIADQHPEKLVVFFRWGVGDPDPEEKTGNGNAWPPDTEEVRPPEWAGAPDDTRFVTMPCGQPEVDQNPTFFAHELGHHFGLYHTQPWLGDTPFVDENTTAAEAEVAMVRYLRENGTGALDGDLLGSTSEDPGTAFWLSQSLSRCYGPNSVTLSGWLDGLPYSHTLTPPRMNIMSYYGCPGGAFTAEQIEIMQYTLEHSERAYMFPARNVGTPALGPQSVVGSAHRLSVALTDDDDHVRLAGWDSTQCEGDWQGWARIAGGVAAAGAPVSSVRRSGERLDFFVVPGDGRIYTSAYDPNVADGELRGWWRITSGLAAPGSPVGAVARASNNLDVFVAGTNGRVYTAAYDAGVSNGQWRGWWRVGELPVPTRAPITAVSRGSGMIDIFVVGNDGYAYTASWDHTVNGGNWQPWERVGNYTFPPRAVITAVSRGSGVIDLFGTDVSGRIVTASWSSFPDQWSNWSRIRSGSAPAGATVTAVARQSSMLDVFVASADGRVWTAAWDAAVASGQWRGWWTVAGGRTQPGAAVPVVARGSHQLDVFAVGDDSRVWTAAWDSAVASGQWRGWWPIAPDFCN